MPYNVKDFETSVKHKMYLKVKPHGWIYDENGIELEFGWVILNPYDPEQSMCMHIKGTDHYWAWFQTNFVQLSKGNYAELFTKQLEEFRLDFLLWIKDPNTARLPWVREYYEIFKGRFYDFSPEEQQEYLQAKSEWATDQSDLDNLGAEIRKQRMPDS